MTINLENIIFLLKQDDHSLGLRDPSFSAWCHLMECYKEHEKMVPAGVKGVSTLYSKPPPHLSGVALVKTEHSGIKRKDEGEEAHKEVWNEKGSH